MIIQITISDTNYITSSIDKKCCTGFLELKKNGKLHLTNPYPKFVQYTSQIFLVNV